MQNIISVTEYLEKTIVQLGGNPTRETLKVIRPRSGADYYTDHEGGAWRVFPFVKDIRCYQSADTPELFEAAGRAFGSFQRMLANYPAPTLHKTIPRFHDTEDRLSKLFAAVEAAPMDRVKTRQPEIDFVMARRADCSVALQALRNGILPLRVTHNDTKLNNILNILFDAKTNQGLCIIDLDTVMPGLSINDFGAAIRFGANHCAEDETNLNKVNFDINLYEVYVRGFLAGTQGCLTPAELEYMPWGARLMTLECGIRFLTDYLSGDTYFHIQRKGHNLDRARTQFKLVRDMEQQFDKMAVLVSKYV